MKNLNEKEIKLIKGAIRSEIESAEDNIYIESKRNNERSIKEIEKYIKELETVYKKL